MIVSCELMSYNSHIDFCKIDQQPDELFQRMIMSKDNLGDRIKKYESTETCAKFMHGLPIIIRLDGRTFSAYTKNFNRPFDDDMSNAMMETTQFLVKETNAVMGYTQSDEITLILNTDDEKSELIFGGKKFKIISNLSSLASVKFYTTIKDIKGDALPQKLPSFDCRAFHVPSKIEAWNVLLWRVQDATRNSVNMLARAYFSQQQLYGKSNNQLIEMLFEQKGIKWVDLESRYKQGIFVRSKKILKPITQELIDTNSEYQVGDMVQRSVIQQLIFEKKFSAMTNREEFLFGKAEPQFKQESDVV